MLIAMTAFFRDLEAFEALERHALPELVRRKPDGATLRIWVPGCSTGEEAYSLAISAVECVEREGRHLAVKVLSSDPSQAAVATARSGRYEEAKLQGVGPERLSRFFERVEGGFRVKNWIRELCAFAVLDLRRDPPFTKLDLISCRNVLVYLGAELRRQVLPMFHRCLNTPGYLFLGGSESIDGFGKLFVPVEDERRIFLKTGESPRIMQSLAAGREAQADAMLTINEELESAKEELQAINKELTTVNEELIHRNHELDSLANDLENVLASVEIPVIIVDRALRVRRFTPVVRTISSLLPGDVGRSIEDVKLELEIGDLAVRINETLDAAELKEWEVQSQDGRWFRLQIRPYRTADRLIDGAILSFVDVDVLKRAAQQAERARDYSQSIVETVPSALVVLDEELRVVLANHAFHQGFATTATAIERLRWFELAGGAWDSTALREAIVDSLTTRSRFRELEIQQEFPGVGRRVLSLSGSPIQTEEGALVLLLAIEDVTERRLLEASEYEAKLQAEQANRAKDLFLATLSHELRTPLGTMLMAAQVLQTKVMDDPQLVRATAAIERAVGSQTRLVDDLLDISRIVSGKLMLEFQAIDLAGVAQRAVDVARRAAEAKGIDLRLTVHGEVGSVHGDAGRLQQVVANLLDNAIKFTPSGQIRVDLEAIDGRAQLVVADTGMGVAPAVLPHLFDRFVQAESSITRGHGGLGLGLAIVRYLVEVHGGEVRAESAGEGRGATFRVLLPLGMARLAAAVSALSTWS